jgi:hypothetical protein
MSIIPFTFVAGQQAKADEVNANFDAVADALGDIDADNFPIHRALVLGPRQDIQIQAQADDGNSSRRFLHIGWNAEYYKSGSTWKYRRYLSSNPATAFQIGPAGFAVKATSATSGSLDSQLDTKMALRIKSGANNDYLYVGPPIQRYDRTALSIQDYRTGYVFLDDPVILYGGSALSATKHVYKATDYGIPDRAKGIAISAEVQAGSDDAVIRFVQERSERNRKWGFSVRAMANHWATGWGFVPLGEGGYDDKFVVIRDAAFAAAYVYIVGFLE